MKLVSSETFWRPRKQGNLMAVPFLADGVTRSNIAIIHDARKFKALAIVLDTNNCKTVTPGDVILFKEGAYELMHTSEEEEFYLMGEDSIIMVMNNLFQEQDKPITSLAPALPIDPILYVPY